MNLQKLGVHLDRTTELVKVLKQSGDKMEGNKPEYKMDTLPYERFQKLEEFLSSKDNQSLGKLIRQINMTSNILIVFCLIF